MQNIVSICVAAYNVESYISECLESIIHYENNIQKEIIVVDDCSNDNTVKVVRSMIEKYPEQNIILIENNQNLGPAGSYNVAVKHAHGKYITFLDSDDFLIASGIQQKLDMLHEFPDMQVVYGNGQFYEGGDYTGIIQNHIVPIFAGGVVSVKRYIQTTVPMLSVSCSLIRKDFFDTIGGFDASVQSNDWVLNLKIFQNIDSETQYGYILTPVFAYRIHANNISKDQNRMEKLLTQVVDRYIPEEYKKIAYSNIYFFISLNLILQSQYRQSLRFFHSSIVSQFRLSRVFVYSLAFISPVGYIARNYPSFFIFLKKSIQKFFS